MKQLSAFYLAILLVVFGLEGCNAQPSKQGQALTLITSVPLPDVSGRIDHLAYDSSTGRIFVAALGNNSVEVVDLRTSKVVHSIGGLNEPQGLAFIPDQNVLFVANGGNGAVDVFNAATYQKLSSIQLPGDADNVRYDALNKKVYVGYGGGGIGVIDAVTFKLITDIKLQGHPESFQLDIPVRRLYVNVPGQQQIAVIDLDKQLVINRWKITEAKANFPMALDAVNHRLFIGCRHPAKLLVIDSNSGKLMDEIDTDADADDIFYNPTNKNIYMSCGGGYIDVFVPKDNNTYTLLEKIATHSGARTALFIFPNNSLVIASPKGFSHSSEVIVYKSK